MSNEDFAKNPNTPAGALAMLSTSPNETVRMLVAGNPNTPVAALRHLVNDESAAVRDAVARNPNTPYDAFEMKKPAAPELFIPEDGGQPSMVGRHVVSPAPSAPPAQATQTHHQPQTSYQPPAQPAVSQPKASFWQRLRSFFGME